MLMIPTPTSLRMDRQKTLKNIGLSFLTENVAMCVCMGMFQMGVEVFQEFGPKGFSRRGTEGGLLVIWPGESAFFSFGEDRLWITFFAV